MTPAGSLAATIRTGTPRKLASQPGVTLTTDDLPYDLIQVPDGSPRGFHYEFQRPLPDAALPSPDPGAMASVGVRKMDPQLVGQVRGYEAVLQTPPTVTPSMGPIMRGQGAPYSVDPGVMQSLGVRRMDPAMVDMPRSYVPALPEMPYALSPMVTNAPSARQGRMSALMRGRR